MELQSLRISGPPPVVSYRPCRPLLHALRQWAQRWQTFTRSSKIAARTRLPRKFGPYVSILTLSPQIGVEKVSCFYPEGPPRLGTVGNLGGVDAEEADAELGPLGSESRDSVPVPDTFNLGDEGARGDSGMICRYKQDGRYQTKRWKYKALKPES